ETIAYYAQFKGLDLLGTGDFTQPRWLNIIKEKLDDEEGKGLLKLRGKKYSVLFVLSSEVNTVYRVDEKARRVHHVILAPSLEVVDQINEGLAMYGNLSADGRPTLLLSSEELVELLRGIDKGVEIFPAHIWTPHYSIFGAHGHSSVEEAYGRMADKINALETGLSSDPPMNWRISKLDKFILVSNSDSHSPYPWRIGREANLFDLRDLTFGSLLEAFRERKHSRLISTFETFPQYGKYHWPGHRLCNVRVSPQEYKNLNGVCPKCHKRLTTGVDLEVDLMADRPLGFRPKDSPEFFYTLPLSELIATVKHYAGPNSPKTWKIYNELIPKLGNEYKVILSIDLGTIATVAGQDIADAISALRDNKVYIDPGYDGVYGSIKLQKTKKRLNSFM
ncbi:MAG: endonuclease Q family protein, partial [Thermoproteota archaeon]